MADSEQTHKSGTATPAEAGAAARMTREGVQGVCDDQPRSAALTTRRSSDCSDDRHDGIIRAYSECPYAPPGEYPEASAIIAYPADGYGDENTSKKDCFHLDEQIRRGESPEYDPDVEKL
jgi:hypothetical protein